MELIDRKKAKEEILSWAVVINKPTHLVRDDTMKVLDTLPTVDVAPVRHGKWALNSDETHWECSECGSHAPDVIDEENGYQVVEWLSSYCPHCGADMWEVDHEID